MVDYKQESQHSTVNSVKTNERGYVSIADFLNANKNLLEVENAAQRQI